MKNNVLVMREEEMDTAISGYEKCYTNADGITKNVPNKFSNVKNTGLFNNGLNTINQQLNSISTSIFNVKNIMKKHSDGMFNMDLAMAKKAEALEMPQDFVKNDSMQFNNFNQTLLEKLDGKSVNAGGGLQNIGQIADSGVVAKALGSIAKNSTTKEETYDASTNILAGKMANINNQNGLGEQRFDGNSSVIRENLHDISNGSVANAQKTAESINVGNSTMYSANNIKTSSEQFTSGAVASSQEASNNTSSPVLDTAADVFNNKMMENSSTTDIGMSFKNKLTDIAQNTAETLNDLVDNG